LQIEASKKTFARKNTGKLFRSWRACFWLLQAGS